MNDELLNGQCPKCHRIIIDCECEASPLHYPVKIKLITHDGGPCPVESDCIVKAANGVIYIIYGCKLGSESTQFKTGLHEAVITWKTVVSYCPIEIEIEED